MTIMSYPEVPLWITGIYCREEADRMPCNFHGMLVAENMDGLKSCGLYSVDETVANHINLDGLPLRMERVLRNGHLDSAPGNTFLSILHSIILWGLGVEEYTK
jgi:hypothetical protein